MSKEVINLPPMPEGYINPGMSPVYSASMMMAYAEQAVREALATQPAQGCDYCNHPQYAGTKCKNCGREQPAQQISDSQDDWSDWKVIPPQAQPAQRKPLTDEQIRQAVRGAGLSFTAPDFKVARAIEAAHGIKGGA